MHLAARGVEHDRVRLHQLELLFAEHVAGLLGQHDVERHHVGLAQQRLVVDRLDAVGEEMRRRHVGIVGDDARAPRRQQLRDPGADAAEADQADGLAGKAVRGAAADVIGEVVRACAICRRARRRRARRAS